MDADARTSALKFGSDDPRSLIRAGSVCWRYDQIGEELRYITGYAYDVRRGLFGRVFDLLFFRPFLGCATAWSFDRLRQWIGKGTEPRQAARQALIHAVAGAALAFLWIRQGLSPKILALHPADFEVLVATGIPEFPAPSFLGVVCAAEAVFGLAFPSFASRRWLWLPTILSMAVGLFVMLAAAPEPVLRPLRPLVLNLSMAAVACIVLLSLREQPLARRCLRRRPKEGSERTRR